MSQKKKKQVFDVKEATSPDESKSTDNKLQVNQGNVPLVTVMLLEAINNNLKSLVNLMQEGMKDG